MIGSKLHANPSLVRVRERKKFVVMNTLLDKMESFDGKKPVVLVTGASRCAVLAVASRQESLV